MLTSFQYLGPSALQLSHLFVLVVVNSLVLFGLILLLGRSVWGLALNMTTIESWEVERHHALLRRARVLGGQLDGPDGTKVRIEHQEFPWDVGIWSNFRQAMGTWNLLAWGWPFASSPSVESGLAYEHNEIDGRSFLSRGSTIVLTLPYRPFQAMASSRPRQGVQSSTRTSIRRWLHTINGHK
jgi:palmitoyltransferase